MKLLIAHFLYFTIQIFVSNGQNDIPNVLINEVNAFFQGPKSFAPLKQFVELISVDNINVSLTGFTLLLFDQDGNTFYDFPLQNLSTYLKPDQWLYQITQTPLRTNSSCGVALYYMLDAIIPDMVEFDNPNHILVDALVYKPKGYTLPINLNLQKLMYGQPLVESQDYNNPQYDGGDPSLCRCRGFMAMYGPSYVNAKTSTGPNICPAINFVLNEFHVNFEGSSLVNEFIEIRSSLDPPSQLNLTDVTLVVMDSTLKNVVYQVSLNGHSLNSDGYFTVGDHTSCSTSNPNCINLQVDAQQESEFLPAGAAAIALFFGNLKFEDMDELRDHLIDAAVYTVNMSLPLGELTAALTPGQGPIYLLETDDENNDQSISRTYCCNQSLFVCNQSLYYWAGMSPDEENNVGFPAKIVLWNKTQNLVRINEVLFELTETDLNVSFVELYYQGSVDLTGLVVVFYSASTEEAFLMCSCLNVATDEDGFAECPCETGILIDVKAASTGSVVLQYGTEGDYEYSNATYGASLGYVDALLYQLSDDGDINLLQKYFAPNQIYYTRASSSDQNQIDISRCYGINDQRPAWQASFAVSATATRMAPNDCPLPQIYINEIHINSSYVELYSIPEELPLDKANLAFITDNNGVLNVTLSLDLKGLTMESNGLFTIGQSNAVDMPEMLPFDTKLPSVVAVYWNVLVSNLTTNPTNKGLLQSVVFSNNDSPIPQELLIFGSTKYEVDDSGHCSLTLCNVTTSNYQSQSPSPNMTAVCTGTCLIPTTIPPSTSSEITTTTANSEMTTTTTSSEMTTTTTPMAHHSSNTPTTTIHHSSYSSSATTEGHHSSYSNSAATSGIIQTTANAQIQNTVRLNEIHFDVGRKSILFSFAELFAPSGIVDLTGLSIVFYSAETSMSFAVCSCNGLQTNVDGYAVCNCPLSSFSSDVSFAGAIALQLADNSQFSQPVNVEQGSTMNVIDVILYQSSGQLVTNPLSPYFITNQQYQIAPPTQSDYSIVRCFGNPTEHAKWQASFTTTIIETIGAPNNCPNPTLYINEVHFTENYIELVAESIELPLDQASIAFISDNGDSAIVSEIYSLYGQNVMESAYFTIGSIPKTDFNVTITLPDQNTAAMVLYWNISVARDTAAPTTNFLSSIVYSSTDTVTVPSSLLPFGNNAYTADFSGQCSLSVCTDDINIFDYAPPTIDLANDCSKTCPGGSPKTTLPSTKGSTSIYTSGSMFINEVYYDYDSGSSYVELSSSLQLNSQTYFLLFFSILNNGTSHQYSAAHADIFMNPNMYWVASNDNASANLTDSNVALVSNGPGAVMLAMKLYPDNDDRNISVLDTVFYTTNASSAINTESVNKFSTDDYAIVNDNYLPYTSISRCLPQLKYQPAFFDSRPTLGAENLCPSVRVVYTLSFYDLELDCESTSFIPIMIAGWDAVLAEVIPLCNCGVTKYNLNYNGQTTYDAYSCIPQGAETTMNMFGVDSEQLDRFTTAYNQYLSTYPTLTINATFIVTFTNGTEITIKGPSKTNWALWIGLIVAVVIILIILVVIVVYCVYRRRKRVSPENNAISETYKKTKTPNWTLKSDVLENSVDDSPYRITTKEYNKPAVDELLINHLGPNLVSEDIKL